MKAVDYVHSLSRKQHAPLLAQLAANMAAVMRENSYSEEDKFAKVKDMIRDMIVKLEAEQKKTADKIAYCNKEMAETKASEKEIKDQLDAVTTELDQMTSRSEKLTEDVAMLETALKDIQASQVEMDKLRKEEKAVYTKQRANLEQGVEGVKLALQVLKEYYEKAGESGSATGIIEMLELVESDFSKSLAEIISVEESAAATYESETKENAVEKATKAGDSKFKSKEIVRLADSISGRKSDLTGIKDQHKAVMDYLSKLKEDCVVKAPSYAEKKAKRDAEIAGLKEAQRILEEEAAFVQRKITSSGKCVAFSLPGIHKWWRRFPYTIPPCPLLLGFATLCAGAWPWPNVQARLPWCMEEDGIATYAGSWNCFNHMHISGHLVL